MLIPKGDQIRGGIYILTLSLRRPPLPLGSLLQNPPHPPTPPAVLWRWARRGVALICHCPEPTAGKRELPLQASRRRSSTSPQIPKNTSQLAVHFEFLVFPDFPQTQKAQLGPRTASGEWFSRGLGLQFKRPPPVEAGRRARPLRRPGEDNL